ncbi:MAG: hypothetical protein JW939_07670, partial [Candidatus Thermoplasmatota archaeon]|nr:hypothetical protein [Candidatus Thermoplasmatota archaeon]
VTLTMNVLDLDGTGAGLIVRGIIRSTDAEFEKEVFFDLKGEDTFFTRVYTDGSWPLGDYDIEVTVRDQDGARTFHQVPLLFVLDAEPPFLQTSELYLALDMNASVEVTFGKGPGATSPGSVTVFLYSKAGDLIASAVLLDSNGTGLWASIIPLNAVPVSGNLMMTDDHGRTIWFNDSIEINVEDLPSGPQEEPEDGQNWLLLIMVIVLTAVLLLALVMMFVLLVMRRRDENNMVPAPPPFIGLEPQHISTLGPAAREALPPTSTGEALPDTVPAPAPPLPPGTVLEDGASYHKPDQKTSQPRARSPSKAEIEPVDPAGGDTDPPTPPTKEDQSSVPPAELSNTPSGVDPPEPYVRDTDDPQVPGDTGQG